MGYFVVASLSSVWLAAACRAVECCSPSALHCLCSLVVWVYEDGDEGCTMSAGAMTRQWLAPDG